MKIKGYMLTNQQKEELEKLRVECQIPSLRKVLDKAIPKWISGEIIPIQDKFGIGTSENGKMIAYDRECCLLGTALIEELFVEVEKWNDILNLSMLEWISIHRAFDDRVFYYDVDKEIVDYVTKLRICLFGK